MNTSNVSASSLALQLAAVRSGTLGALVGSSADFDSILQAASNASSPVDALFSKGSGKSVGLSADGHNMSLFDPQSAFDMMSVINKKDVDYKAQYSELSQMGSGAASLASTAQDLAGISAATGDADMRTRLQAFVDQYNGWIKRFDADMQKGGLLSGTQAAQVARHELDAGIDNRFYGARDGVRGLQELGITTDPVTGLASFDTAKFDAALARNRSGVVDTVQEFATGFATAANLLNSAGNFIPNQLNNLSGAIHYIDANIASWRSEFGTGSAATPDAQTARALAAYNKANAA
ncbi:MAG: flagellar filament capping protein FliD [Ignavibacteria bacterium]